MRSRELVQVDLRPQNSYIPPYSSRSESESDSQRERKRIRIHCLVVTPILNSLATLDEILLEAAYIEQGSLRMLQMWPVPI